MKANELMLMDTIDHVLIDEIERDRGAMRDMIKFSGVDVRSGRRRSVVRFYWEEAEDGRRKPKPWEYPEILRKAAQHE